jgi:hypothetical protein
MLRIKETIFDSHGAMRSRELLPVIFVDREPAIQFIHMYLLSAFTEGARGYEREDDYWWGREDTPEVRIFVYTIE